MIKFFKFIYDEIDYRVYNFYNWFRKIKRFLLQLPSLLALGYNNCYDVDWGYSLNFLEYKLKRLQNHIKEHQFYVGWEISIEQIDKFLKLIHEAVDEADELPEMKEDWENFYNKYGHSDFTFVDNKLIPKRTKPLNEQELEEANSIRNDLYTKEYHIRETKWNEAMDMLKTNMRSWWC